MNKVFDAYAAYYDLLYRDKDYEGESAWVDSVIQSHRPGAKSLLEFGSGTGGHALHLSRLGYEVMGFDLSQRMVDNATKRKSEITHIGRPPEFFVGDMRTLRVEARFDVVASLFHVMSYQISNQDLLAAMTTAATHLEPGGIFLFDTWYGPGVLIDPPSTRVRRLRGEDFSITRIAEPVHHQDLNRVDIHYEMFIEREGGLERLQERHEMRYLFTPEIEFLLSSAGLRLCASCAWLSDAPPSASSWHACYVARKEAKLPE